MKKYKNIFKYVSIGIIALFVILVAVQSGKRFVLDEIDFPTVSLTTSQTGRPVYYHSEQEPQHLGTYHPTMYINSLATFIRIFGFSEATVRFFGVICVLLSAYLLLLIYRQLSKKKNYGLETLFLGIYLLNPYTIASATLPDIDPTVLPIFFLLFIYVSLKYVLHKRALNQTTVIILSVFFALALWTKLTTPLVLPFLLLGIASIVTHNFKRSLIFTAKVFGLGAVMFVVSYFIYCVALRLSPTYTYTFLVESFTKGTSSEGPIRGVITNLGYFGHFIFWITIPLVGLLGVSILHTILDKSKDAVTNIKKLLILTALLVTIFYIALISPFGGFFKYPFPVFGILLLSIIFMCESFRTVNLSKMWPYLAAALLAGGLMEDLVWKDSMFFSLKPFAYTWILLVLVLLLYVALIYRKSRHAAQLSIVLVLAFALGFQMSVSRIQAIAQYPTKYLYGQMGMGDAISYLKLHTKPNEVIWSMKDIGYYVNNRYLESYYYYSDPSLKNNLIDLLKSGKVRYFVATTGIGEDSLSYYTNIKDILNKYATEQEQFGNYVIYESNSALRITND